MVQKRRFRVIMEKVNTNEGVEQRIKRDSEMEKDKNYLSHVLGDKEEKNVRENKRLQMKRRIY